MKKMLIVSLSLLVLFTTNALGFDINNIFNAYKHKNIELCFKQVSINGMTGQSIERCGVMKIIARKMMKFNYIDEKIIIDNFKAIDIKGNKKYAYKLSGFNKVLFNMFLGKKDIKELFYKIKINNSTYKLVPKYQSNISSVYVHFLKDRVKKIKIVDIYANKTIYTFYDFPCK